MPRRRRRASVVEQVSSRAPEGLLGLVVGGLLGGEGEVLVAVALVSRCRGKRQGDAEAQRLVRAGVQQRSEAMVVVRR